MSSQPKLLPPNSKSSISETIDAPARMALAETTSGSPTTRPGAQAHHCQHLTDTVGQHQFLILDYLKFDRHTEPSFNKQVGRETAIPRDTPQSNLVTVV
jgi:hypothetical protein